MRLHIASVVFLGILCWPYHGFALDPSFNSMPIGKASLRKKMPFSDHVVFSPEVQAAIDRGDAVVALESTVICHGLPYPQNFETGKLMEGILREGGVTPATIAIWDGNIHVGLTEEEMIDLANTKCASAVKTSRRDISFVVGTGKVGATTVSGTSAVAALVGIKVFVTGGLGGVHRHGESTMDVSADLTELGRSPVAVVCAGVKSILDIGRTLEYLETQGVPVIGYQTDDFPAFFSATSGYKTSARADSAEEIAEVIATNYRLGMESGLVIANPIPPEDAAEADAIERATQTALEEADKAKVIGKEITPFILKRVKELTKGDSLRANIALLKNNARVGAAIARYLADILRDGHKHVKRTVNANNSLQNYDVVVFGGSVMDSIGKSHADLILGTSNPGAVSQSFGGVGKNIAEVLTRLGSPPLFVSAVGTDAAGKALLSYFESVGLRTDGILRSSNHSTATYTAFLNPNGEMILAMADMNVFEDITKDYVRRYAASLSGKKVVVVDGNLQPDVLQEIVAMSSRAGVSVWFEPTSIAKALRAAKPEILSKLTYISPNRGEGFAMAKLLDPTFDESVRDLESCKKAVKILLDHVGTVLLKMGADGILIGNTQTRDSYPPIVSVRYTHVPAPKPSKIINVTGAGDNFVGGVVWGLSRGETLERSVEIGTKCAQMSLESEAAVSPLLSASSVASL